MNRHHGDQCGYKIQHQRERLTALLRAKQRFVSQVLDSMLAQASS